jgi:hypothetical protein
MRTTYIFLTAISLISTASGQNYTLHTTEKTNSVYAFVDWRSGYSYYYAAFRLSFPEDNNKTDSYSFSYSVVSCTEYGASGCSHLSGYGPIQAALVTQTAEAIAVSLNAGALPPPFQVSGPPATVQISWRKDGYRTERVTGVQTSTNYGAFVYRTIGTFTNYSTHCTLLLNGETLTPTRSDWRELHSGRSSFYFQNRYVYTP